MADTGTSTQRQSPNTQRRGTSPSPGNVGMRLNYALHETVTRTQRADKVLEARALHDKEYTGDILGLRGQPWNATVAPDTSRGKHSISASDARLSNTLQPRHISATDFRKTSGPTSSPTRPAAFDRGTAEWGISSSTWNTSVQPDDVAQQRKRVEEFTMRSKERTAAVASQLPRYISPIERQQQVIDRVRHQKQNQGVDYEALVEKWGEEGARHLLQIEELQRKKAEKEPCLGTTGAGAGGRVVAGRRAGRPRAPLQDVEAVHALQGLGDEDEAQNL